MIKGIMCALHYVIGQNLLFRSQFHAERVEDYLVSARLTSSRFSLLILTEKFNCSRFCVIVVVDAILTRKSFFSNEIARCKRRKLSVINF